MPLREALGVLGELSEQMFVRVAQEPIDGSERLEWLGKAGTLDAFASRVRPGVALRVYLAPMGSRQEFTIELDESGAVRRVSPITGHAD